MDNIEKIHAKALGINGLLQPKVLSYNNLDAWYSLAHQGINKPSKVFLRNPALHAYGENKILQKR